ncbi:MAG: DedA family protein [Bacteroidaceae bacterium]|nr:DedA family protein [Bacteroidaceae bacterium]MBR1800484.1 DedA family protein [Bacteroidaceae bacterium]
MSSFIAWCIDHLNYWTITFLMTLESTVIPIPSELVVPPAAYRAATEGSDLNVILIVLCATLGANIGAMINYVAARYLGRPIIYAFANSTLGHLCLLNEQKVQKTEEYFNRHGAVGTLIGRLVPGIRHLISIPAGLARMKLSHFILYTTLGAGLWNIILAAIGYSLQSVVPEDQLMEKVNEYSHELGIAMIALFLLLVAYLVYKGVRNRTPDRSEHRAS